MATADWGDRESLAGVGEVVALWQTDEEAAADSRSLRSLLPASSRSDEINARCGGSGG